MSPPDDHLLWSFSTRGMAPEVRVAALRRLHEGDAANRAAAALRRTSRYLEVGVRRCRRCIGEARRPAPGRSAARPRVSRRSLLGREHRRNGGGQSERPRNIFCKPATAFCSRVRTPDSPRVDRGRLISRLAPAVSETCAVRIRTRSGPDAANTGANPFFAIAGRLSLPARLEPPPEINRT